jgi:hypothetical protein
MYLPLTRYPPPLPHPPCSSFPPSITRNTLGPHKAVCITIPSVFFVTSLIVDYVLHSMQGLGAFEATSDRVIPILDPTDPAYDPTLDPSSPAYDPHTLILDGTQGLVYFICSVANTMVFFLVWYYIFELCRIEQTELEMKIHGPKGMVTPEQRAAAEAAGFGGEGGVGHAEVPTGDAALLEAGANVSHMYGATIGEFYTAHIFLKIVVVPCLPCLFSLPKTTITVHENIAPRHIDLTPLSSLRHPQTLIWTLPNRFKRAWPTAKSSTSWANSLWRFASTF